MKIQLKGEILECWGAHMKLTEILETAKGNYIVREESEDSDGMTHNHTKRYPVKMENNKMIPLKSIDDEKVKKEIEEFKFFVDRGISKNWKTIKRTKCHITQKYQYIFTISN